MEVNLEDIKPQTKTSEASKMLRQPEEMRNFKKTRTVLKTEFTTNEINDDNTLLTSLPKSEIKMRKLDESKLLMDNNENSLSVDTLIEILSSNETNKLPMTASTNDKSNRDKSGPTRSASSTLSSPSSSSSSSKIGVSETIASPSQRSSEFVSPKKVSSPYHLNGGKPMISDMNKKMKQVSKRQPKAVYRSQISDNSIGIKLCIKKSVDSKKSLPSPIIKTPKKRARKSKVKIGQESDSDDAYVKRRKKASVNNNNNNNIKTSFDEPVEQSGWGKEMPKEILFDVSFQIYQINYLNRNKF